MAARSPFTYTCLQSSMLAMTIRASQASHPMRLSLLLIQTRSKISKTSPFGKRNNPMKKHKEDILKTMSNVTQMAKHRPLERPQIIDSPGMIFSDYLPVRRAFFLTPSGLIERWKAFVAGYQSLLSLIFLRKHCKPFKLKQFAKEAQDLYIDLNNAVVSKDKHKLQELATGNVYLALRHEYFPPNRYLHWRFLSAISRPKVVHVRVNPVETKQNLFAQVTVRLHSKQVMALKDSYGRHIKGSDKDAKEVVDYVVFERHIVHRYGKWRVCGKLFPPVLEKEKGSKIQLTRPAPLRQSPG